VRIDSGGSLDRAELWGVGDVPNDPGT